MKLTGRIPSAHYTPGRAGMRPRLIVLHTMQAPETRDRAEQVARWFAGDTAPQSSVHYCVDDREAWGCVPEADTAWAVGHAPTNRVSVSIELAGYAQQNDAQWNDSYSYAMLRRAAALVADIAVRHHIPLTHVLPSQIAAGKPGICGHDDITAAFKVPGGHTDPGKAFPWPDFLQLVIAAKGIQK